MCPKWKTWTNHFLSIKFLTNQIKESSIFLSVVFFFYPTNQTDLKLVTKQWGIIIELWRWEATDSVETFDGGTTDLLTCREWGIWIPLLRVKSIQVNNVRVSCHLSLSSHGGRLLNALGSLCAQRHRHNFNFNFGEPWCVFHFAMTFFLSIRGLHASNVPTCTVKR